MKNAILLSVCDVISKLIDNNKKIRRALIYLFLAYFTKQLITISSILQED